MAKRFLFCLMAVVMILGVVLVGCGDGGGPQAVTLNVLIRTEDERKDMGEYAALQLEKLGFKVTRTYGTSGQVAGIAYYTDPAEGLWNVYTGGWVSTAVPRDESTNFGFYYTPLASYMGPLWTSYTPSPEFLNVATKLWTANFSTLSERKTLFEQGLNLSLEDSVRVWLCERNGYSPLAKDVHLAADGAGGIYASRLWAHTVHFRNTTNNQTLLPTGNTTLKVSTAGNIFRYPWNPIGGSNWVYDQFPIRATMDDAFEYDVRDGLVWNHTAEKAEVYIKSGLPISHNASHTWCTLTNSTGNISVPGTAWADWNATSQQWITVGQKYGAGNTTTLVKTVVYYPTGTFGRPIHDGSNLSAADFLLRAILVFDRGKAASAIYDAVYAPELDAFMTHFKGLVFNFTTPGYDLIVTTYDDLWYLDAELIANQNSWFPSYTPSGSLGPWIWHTLALAILGEEDGKLAFTSDKADLVGGTCEWTSFVLGPSLGILNGYLLNVTTPGNPDYRYLPYRNVLGAEVNNATIDARYQNLKNWYGNYTNFWVATGPYYLQAAISPDQVVLKRFASYPDNGNDWFFMMNPVPPSNNPAQLGGWVDTITIKEQLPAQAVAQLGTGQLDVYAFALIDEDLKTIIDSNPNLWVYYAKGSFNELTLNPAGPVLNSTGEVNPFGILAIREALNLAMDRDYIVSELMNGNGIKKWTCISSLGTGFAESLRYTDLLAAIEAKYPYNLAAANQTIYNEMTAIPGVTYVDGQYYYEAP